MLVSNGYLTLSIILLNRCRIYDISLVKCSPGRKEKEPRKPKTIEIAFEYPIAPVSSLFNVDNRVLFVLSCRAQALWGWLPGWLSTQGLHTTGLTSLVCHKNRFSPQSSLSWPKRTRRRQRRTFYRRVRNSRWKSFPVALLRYVILRTRVLRRDTIFVRLIRYVN